MKKVKKHEPTGKDEPKVDKKISTEAHELLQIILPRVDELAIAVRDGKYDNAYAYVFISDMLHDIDNFLEANKMKYIIRRLMRNEH